MESILEQSYRKQTAKARWNTWMRVMKLVETSTENTRIFIHVEHEKS